MQAPNYVCAVHPQIVTGEDTCGTFGTSVGQQRACDSIQQFYLNTQNPSTCKGTINSVQLCFYRSKIGTSYISNFAIYRRARDLDENVYNIVSSVFTASRNSSNRGFRTFSCIDVNLNKTVLIEPGDVLDNNL